MGKFSLLFVYVFISSLQSHGAVPSSSKWALHLAPDKGTVEFDAIGRPSALKIHGKGSAPRGSLTLENSTVTGNLTFDLESLDTGIKTRNEHMKKKYLETEKFKEATLTLSKLSIPETVLKENGSAEGVPFSGSLSLHGVQKPVTGVVKVNRKDQEMTVDARFDIKTNDYGIAAPSFAGITMGEDVKVHVQFTTPMSSIQ